MVPEAGLEPARGHRSRIESSPLRLFGAANIPQRRSSSNCFLVWLFPPYLDCRAEDGSPKSCLLTPLMAFNSSARQSACLRSATADKYQLVASLSDRVPLCCIKAIPHELKGSRYRG